MERTGVWLIGARGSISLVTVAGHAAVTSGLAPPAGLVTERTPFHAASLMPLDNMVFGGHDVRALDVQTEAARVLADCGIPTLAPAVSDALGAYAKRIRPGVVRGAGVAIEAFADDARAVQTDAEAVALVRADLDAFKAEHRLARLVVVNLASTEPPATPHAAWLDLDALEQAMASTGAVLPPSSLYAYAAFQGGDAFVNFTPSLGSRVPALAALALARGAVHAGCDGKTGETLVKSVLAELFARRNLPVLSWFGQNILGNEDGRVLDNPENKATKVASKDHLLGKILGYAPESRVGIDYVRSLGEWKIAWDHIHFEGFLGGRMSLQFTWNGCDSILAAPLVLDLVRLADRAQRRGEVGVLTALAPFFKDPMGTAEQRLVAQDEALLAWLAGG